MEREHLHDLVAVRRRRLQLELDAIAAGRELARARQHFVGVRWFGMPSPIRPACATNVRSALRCSARYGLAVSSRIAVLVERDQRDHAAGRVDFGGVEVGRDRDVLAGGRRAPRAAPAARRGCAARRRRRRGGRRRRRQVGGRRVARRGAAGATGGGGACSCCHASHRKSAENEKMTNRMRRWVSMTAWVIARDGLRRAAKRFDQGTGSKPPG